MKHRYRVRIDSISEQANNPDHFLEFEAENHDDIFSIVEKFKEREEFSGDDALAFGVGLKLFSEVMLKKKDYPLFSSFLPHFINFMKELKRR